MNKKIFAITSILTLFSFSSLLYAQEVSTYSFSGFGGGLPSSATIVEATAAPENLSAWNEFNLEKYLSLKINSND